MRRVNGKSAWELPTDAVFRLRGVDKSVERRYTKASSEMTEKSTRIGKPNREVHHRLKVHRRSKCGEDHLPIRPRAARYSGKENQSGWNHGYDFYQLVPRN